MQQYNLLFIKKRCTFAHDFKKVLNKPMTPQPGLAKKTPQHHIQLMA